MPIFEYSCTDCSCHFEKLQKHSTEEKPVCPACGSWETKKEFSAFSSVNSSAPGDGCYSGG
ncbi:MAG: zinc ribbon domain-containing protein [Desulfuromonadaceae bacterium]|nr:zinc ribbon domain-containing protein [Desulfuromonadaceae bacterium]